MTILSFFYACQFIPGIYTHISCSVLSCNWLTTANFEFTTISANFSLILALGLVCFICSTFLWVVCFHMSPQMACLNRCIAALVASVWLFLTVCFQMSPQIASVRWFIVTLVAFVILFPRVSFQMCPQMACLNRCIVALVAFVWFFPRVSFQVFPQSICSNRCIVALVAFVRFFSSVSFWM